MLRSARPRPAAPRLPVSGLARICLAALGAICVVLCLALPGSAAADVPGGTLQGTGPAPGALVDLWMRDSGSGAWVQADTAETGDTGQYVAGGLADGTYALTYVDPALGDGGIDINADGDFGPPSAAQEGVAVTADAGGTLDLPMPALGSSITLSKVTDLAGAPVTNAGLLQLRALVAGIDGPQWVFLADTPTSSSGGFTFSGLPRGTYAVDVLVNDRPYYADGMDVVAYNATLPADGSFGIALDGSHATTLRVRLAPSSSTPDPVPPIVLSPGPSASPSTSASPSPSPSTSPAPPKTPLPSAPPSFEPVPITKVPSSLVLAPGLPASPPIAVVPSTGDGAAVPGLPPADPKDQSAVDQALANEIGLAIAQSGGQQSGPTISARLTSPPSLPPGLYVSVVDGLITVTNTGGAPTFAAGQFGFTPSFQTPPVILPSNPGLMFAPPPAFTQSVTTAITKSAKPTGVDCVVRRVDTGVITPTDPKDGAGVKQSPPSAIPPPVKTYCNRIAVGRISTGHAHHHARWHRHDTVVAEHGQRRVHLPLERLHGPGWYRIVTTYHLVLRFTAHSTVHGKRLKHPVHVQRPAAIRSVTYLHATRP